VEGFRPKVFPVLALGLSVLGLILIVSCGSHGLTPGGPGAHHYAHPLTAGAPNCIVEPNGSSFSCSAGCSLISFDPNSDQITMLCNSCGVVSGPAPVGGLGTISCPDFGGSGGGYSGGGYNPLPPRTTNAQKTWQAANLCWGNDSRAGPHNADGVNVACVWAINDCVLPGAHLPNPSTNAVDAFKKWLSDNGYNLVNKGQTVAGDFAIQGELQHVGVCMVNGCDTVLSNSSTPESFTWWSDPAFSGPKGYDPNITPVFYHLP